MWVHLKLNRNKEIIHENYVLGCKCIPQRRLVTVLLLVASFFFFLFRITMFLFLPYGSDLNDSHEVLLSPFEEGLLIASFFWGYCIGHIPFHYMVTSFNGKSFLLISMLVACLTTLFIPYVFMKGMWSVYWNHNNY